MKISLSLQQDFQSPELELKRAQLKKIIEITLRHVGYKEDCEIGVACVDLEESHQLNLQYREKDKPTNVLSFPSDIPEEVLPMLDALPLGDLVICIPVVLQEALEQKKTAQNHFAHLLVHGVLHLLGYDHEISDEDAEEMEGLEIEILAKLNIANPYQE
ncbi:TPA: rRNA maturation RNase YbeY [Acinetobacter nosocomialis]|uniref:Endoribonuclease YbeY n=1 Tax=Acinetobacter nosocomialis TaxID=106654 RepID=A0AB37CZ67_ACINO|nr:MULTISPECIES: rRNA maturation RNase YbeY [Acinetobacter calcoaceticus/baumannii complex]ELW82168.1 metalloprotein, YbeY family [Acinetobacter sp. OIFC021]EXE49396.1 putative rRNA maturation factor YbeY [Acinetobacter sp. 766875]MDE1667722.1 rRNA maturation RNase YbeY [Acinetobacter nosocomialis]QGA45364.1 rRNA maturation RNase YbeY [Acinetobacter nosocomialis]HDH7780797.1 rRNA maturation RNase YbeY [Acinetobacter nosocomialis]